MKNIYQIETWQGEFGKEYTDRNTLSVGKLDSLYRRNFGITRSMLNETFIGGLAKGMRILEVGSNMGMQLLLLQKMGFENLYGIEINSYAVERSKSISKRINIIQGSAFDVPFKDDYFDMVFTSGVLIHINPRYIKKAMDEIYRSTNTYIWGYEYYADRYTESGNYRGRTHLLWKADFARLYLENFPNLRLLKEKRLKYINNENVDSMFLLRKK